MVRDIVDIQDFTVLIEESTSETEIIDSCKFEQSIIAVAFYGAGDVELQVKYGDKEKSFSHTKGMALSFFADEKVEFIHHVSPTKPLQSILITTSIENLEKLPNQEGELFSELLFALTQPSDHFVAGPLFYMTPEMHNILEQIMNIQYEGKTRMMFFRSQITTLLSHFFGQLAQMQSANIKNPEREKLFEAKAILSNNLETPPSLTELSKQIGLNSFKLKKNFKELFGVPVFKYLQNERLNKAHELLRNQRLSVQEAAWQVGYDSLSSFSNAFRKKYGYRPSEIRT